MRQEWEIRAAVAHLLGDHVRYERPAYGRGIAERLSALENAATAGESFVVLVPARTDTRWMHDVCCRWQIAFIRGRVVLDGCACAAPFPSALVAMGPGRRNDAELDGKGLRQLSGIPELGATPYWQVPSRQTLEAA
jgi:hypothetical protein